VYVIELDRAVLGRRRFARANPGHRPGKPCVYVGSTVLTPEERFEQHRAGIGANRYVRAFGVRLRPRTFRNYGPFETRAEAEEAERRLGERLRRKGYAVWFG
jgi:predicted GIY-YIG superfamily endonuclease